MDGFQVCLIFCCIHSPENIFSAQDPRRFIKKLSSLFTHMHTRTRERAHTHTHCQTETCFSPTWNQVVSGFPCLNNKTYFESSRDTLHVENLIRTAIKRSDQKCTMKTFSHQPTFSSNLHGNLDLMTKAK